MCTVALVVRRALLSATLPLLLALPFGAAAQGAPAGRAPGSPPAGSPCSVLATGGTVFDASECAQLAATGMVVRWTLVAGRTYAWKIVTAPATSSDRTSRAMPVALIRADDRSVVARTVTAPDGSFRLAVPAGASGEMRLVGFPWTGAAPPAETVVCNGAGDCFDYCPLPSIPTTLEPMCAEDPGLVLFVARPRPGGAGPR
ncbi:MAG: hypothetical protein JO040_07940 [Gemmatimonadetes bacterium]|nr:hypothetical protein [Gemmatimonadota bacterium]